MVIYKITNTINNKVYIGQTIQTNAKMRWYSHQADARAGKKSHLYDSIRKYGIENFIWEIIEHGSSVEQLNELEAKWLSYYRTITKVYNNREAGGNKQHSDASLKRMSASQKAAHARRRELNNGIEKTKKRVQTIKSWSSSKKGKPGKKWSEEAKIQHSIRCKERNYAKHFIKQEN